MPREVNNVQSFTDKLVKLIPTEIVGAYAVFAGMIEAAANPNTKRIGFWVIFGSLLLLTPAYLSRISKVKNKLQLVVASLSFAVWAYALGGPFRDLPHYDPLFASVLLGLWSLFTPVLVRPTEQELAEPMGKTA